MVGDRQFTGGANKFKGSTKIYKFKAHAITYPTDFIVGFAGGATNLIPIISFFTNPDDFKTPPRVKGVEGLVLTAEQDIFVFEDYTKWLKVDQTYHSIGSGAAYALGALASGKTPMEAVKISMNHDPYTGMGTTKLKF